MLSHYGMPFLRLLDDVVLPKADAILAEASGVLWEFQLYVRRFRLVLEHEHTDEYWTYEEATH